MLMNSPVANANTAPATTALSPSFLSKPISALEQLCDFAITSQNMTDQLPPSAQHSPLPPDKVKTCVISAYNRHTPSSSSHALLHNHVSEVRVYEGEERKSKIARYLEKRKTKTWNRKLVRYPSRQGSAGVRTRIKGRFVKQGVPQPSPPQPAQLVA